MKLCFLNMDLASFLLPNLFINSNDVQSLLLVKSLFWTSARWLALISFGQFTVIVVEPKQH